MMYIKQFFSFLFLFSALICYSQSKVEALLDTTSIRIGEQLQYKIKVNETQQVVFPDFKSDDQKKAILVAEKPIDTFVNKLEKSYVITYFEEGNYKIPKQTVEINQKKYFTKELLIDVATIAVDTTQQKIYDIKSIQEEPKVFDDYKNIIIYFLIGILLVAVLLYFLTKKKMTPEEKLPKIEPYAEAMQKLKELDKNEDLAHKNIKRYYSELTDISRNYIERTLSISAMELTTNELIDELFSLKRSGSLMIKKETIRTLKNILQNADFVKFAKSVPSIDVTQKDRIFSEQVIQEIKKMTDLEKNTLS